MDVGFIGIGSMGAAMVPNLLKAGHRVKVWNRHAAAAEALAAANFGEVMPMHGDAPAANESSAATIEMIAQVSAEAMGEPGGGLGTDLVAAEVADA